MSQKPHDQILLLHAKVTEVTHRSTAPERLCPFKTDASGSFCRQQVIQPAEVWCQFWKAIFGQYVQVKASMAVQANHITTEAKPFDIPPFRILNNHFGFEHQAHQVEEKRETSPKT